MSSSTCVNKDVVVLKDGTKVPAIGMGTFQSKPGDMTAAIEMAISKGYRAFDGALVYGNEKQLGQAYKSAMDKGLVKREELWISSKLWNSFHSPEHVRQACEITLRDLQLDYLDMYLIHWPTRFAFNGWELKGQAHEEGMYEDIAGNFLETWHAMEKLVEDGLVRNIGVSNFNLEQMKRLVQGVKKVMPSVHQIEVHPYLPQEEMIAFCKSHQIAVTAFAAFGSPNRGWAKSNDPILFEDPVILELASTYKKTPAQILIRFAVDRGLQVIPQSYNEERMTQNISVGDFKLTEADLKKLLSLSTKFRYLWLIEHKANTEWPFHADIDMYHKAYSITI